MSPKSSMIWKKIGIIFSILMACGGILVGYCDTKFKTNENQKDINVLDVKVDKKFDKIELKMDEFSHEQTVLRVQSGEILGMVKFLKEKSKE